MDPDLRQLIEALHRSAGKYVLALTGGGTSAAAHLLTVPGGSRSVLEVVVPYDAKALTEFLGRTPEQYCTEATAAAMASGAYDRAAWLAPREIVAGVGCTASLATDRPKKGEHRFHLAVRTAPQLTLVSLTLAKGARDREGEEAVLAAVLLNLLAETFGVADRLAVPLRPEEALHQSSLPADAPLARFLRGELPALCAGIDGQMRADAPRPAALLPGSFNPLHPGHCQLAEVAAKRTSHPVAFELSVTNVDKPPLSAEEVRHRLRQFAWHAPVWLTRAPTFVEKAALFPGVLFVVGADTAARIVAPQYYEGSEAKMLEALEHIGRLGGRFLVGGRRDAAGKFVGLDELAIPSPVRDLFAGIPESEFRFDLSSTALRQGK
jgi:nicotinamide mononucleotide (NMN) deamidase PncC